MKFKGHTTIELKNVETGEIKKYEDDNMLTNAISKMLNFAATHSLGTNSLDVYSSHWYNLLGGLVLFDTALTEDADNLYPPAGTKPVGYGMAGDTNSYTSVPEWGIYNTQESDTSSTDTKKMVWDFSTSHANGTIASIALTHRNNGLFGFGINSYANTGRTCFGKIALGTAIIQSSKGRQGRNTQCYGVVGSNLSLNDGSYMDFCIDSDNDEKYMFKVCQDGLSIIKHKMYPEQISVFRSALNFQSYEEETYSETFSSGYFYHFYNPDEKCLYFWILSGIVDGWQSQAVSVSIHKFDMTTKTLTKGWKTLSIPSTNYIWNSFMVTADAIYAGGRAVTTGYIKIVKYDTTSGTASDIWNIGSGISGDYSGLQGRKNWIRNGLIYIPYVITYASSQAYTIIIDTSDDTIRYTNTYHYAYNYNDSSRAGMIIPSIDNTQVACGTMLNAGETNIGTLNLQNTEGEQSQMGNMIGLISYLGTINNLSEPIVKTAQQTMKVTYTITVESEE